METQVFINLPVKDLHKSIEFYKKLGFSFKPEFSDNNGACIVVSDTIFLMLLTEAFFKTFTKKEVCDSSKAIETMITISAKSRVEVDEMVEKAIAAGARTPNPSQDHGWMYGRGFEDIDGHHWDMVYMNMDALQPQ